MGHWNIKVGSQEIPGVIGKFGLGVQNEAWQRLTEFFQENALVIANTQQWPQDWKRLVFIPIPKKGNAKECSNYHTIALISHASKAMLKIIQQHKRRLYTWTSPDGQYQNQIDYIFCSQGWRNSTQSAKTRPEADCGSDHKLLIAKFRLKLQKAGKTTRPFRYDLNQIPFNYTMEVTNRSRDLI